MASGFNSSKNPPALKSKALSIANANALTLEKQLYIWLAHGRVSTVLFWGR
jgi:hypothetical protein